MRYQRLFALIESNEHYAVKLACSMRLPAISTEFIAELFGFWSLAADGTLQLNFLDFQADNHAVNLAAFYQSVSQIEKTLQIEIQPADIYIEIYTRLFADADHKYVTMKTNLKSLLDVLNEAEILDYGCAGMLREVDRLQIFHYLRWRRYGILSDNTMDLTF